MSKQRRFWLKFGCGFGFVFPWMMLFVEWAPASWSVWIWAGVAGIAFGLLAGGWFWMLTQLINAGLGDSAAEIEKQAHS